MSRKITAWVLTALTSIALSMGGLMIAPAAFAVDPPPPPVFNDPCGKSQDTVVLPAYYWSTYYINGAPYEQGKTHLAPATDVTVAASGTGGSGSWSFSYTDAPCSSQADDLLLVIDATCDLTFDIWKTTMQFVNSKDNGLSKAVMVRTVRSDGESADNDLGTVSDGSSAPFKPGGELGMLPGTYTATAYSQGLQVAKTTFFLKSCGFENPPPGDPGVKGGKSEKPKGEIRQLNSHSINATAINAGVDVKTTFRMVVKTGSARPSVLKFGTLRPNAASKTKRFEAKAGKRYVLQAKVKNKKGKAMWLTLDTFKLRSRG